VSRIEGSGVMYQFQYAVDPYLMHVFRSWEMSHLWNSLIPKWIYTRITEKWGIFLSRQLHLLLTWVCI